MLDNFKNLLIFILVRTGLRLPHTPKLKHINNAANTDFRLNYENHRKYYSDDN